MPSLMKKPEGVLTHLEQYNSCPITKMKKVNLEQFTNVRL